VVKVLLSGDKQEKKKEPIKYIPIEFLNRSDPEDVKAVDVGYLQSLPEFHSAVFQVASNFNCIEGVSELQSPDVQSFTEFYHKDKTQGPAASISAGAAAIVRVHAPFYEKGKNPSKWQQTLQRQIELLEHLQDYYPVHNGYVLYENGIHLDTYKKFPPYLSKPYYKLLISGLIGYHKEVQVTSGYRWYPKPLVTPRDTESDDEKEPPDESLLQRVHDVNQRVDQVFTAAINMKQGRTGVRNATAPHSLTKSKMILDLGYQGTYLAAAANGRHSIVLTMIGGGSFGNDSSAIFESIVQAHRRWGVEGTSSLKKIYIIAFDQKVDLYSELEEKLKGLGVNVQWRYPIKK